MGNVTATIISAGGKTTIASNYEYDELGRLTDVLYQNTQSSQQYDLNNNPEIQTNGFDATSTNQYDNLNRLTTYIDELNAVTQYTYNAYDQITSVSDDNGATTTYDYDGLGRLIALTSPDTGNTTYQYDDAGNPTEVVDARGQRISQQFDALKRLVEKQYEGVREEDVHFIYDTSRIGKLSSVDTSITSIQFGYDNLGRLTQQESTLTSDNVGEITATTDYGYDAISVLNSITYPSGLTVDYQTNTVGEVTSVNVSGDGLASQNVATNISYNVVGNLQNITFGNGVDLFRTFDADGKATSQSITGIWDLSYAYDPNNNLSDIINNLTETDSKSFSYYFNNRLQTETTELESTEYGFDGVGNRLSLTNESLDDSYNYVSQSNVLGDVNNSKFTYDEAGNTLTSGLHDQTYTYNAEGRLAAVNDSALTASYQYNGLSERVIKQLGDETSLYFYNPAGQLLETQHYQGADKVSSKQIVWLGNTPIAQVDTVTVNAVTTSTLVYIHADHLNTPRKATNEQGVLVWQWQSDAYGNGLPDEDVDQNNQLTTIDLRFPGQIYDAESGLHYNYYRYYDPQLGRYITSDPIGLNGGINTFAYVGGNPIGFVDPLGHKALAVLSCGVFVEGVGALSTMYGINDMVTEDLDNLNYMINVVEEQIDDCDTSGSSMTSEDLKKRELEEIREDLILLKTEIMTRNLDGSSMLIGTLAVGTLGIVCGTLPF